jgi:hypothetical protein
MDRDNHLNMGFSHFWCTHPAGVTKQAGLASLPEIFPKVLGMLLVPPCLQIPPKLNAAD